MSHALEVGKIVATAGVAGWLAVRLLHSEHTPWSLIMLTGLIGVYAGPRLMALTPWWFGPFVGGVPVVPAFLCAALVAAFLKMVGLGAVHPRR
jgi:hypothetical protein